MTNDDLVQTSEPPTITTGLRRCAQVTLSPATPQRALPEGHGFKSFK